MRVSWHTAAVLAVLGWPVIASAQSLTPLADQVHEPLLPTGISRGDVELFGRRVYLFQADDGAEVIHLVGDFELHLGRRPYLSGREAIVWMRRARYQDVAYQRFEIFLRHRARVTESAGTVTTGPVLFITLNSSGKVSIEADDTTRTSSVDSPVYQEGARIRRLIASGRTEDIEVEPALQVIDFEAVKRAAEPVVRPFFYFDAARTESDVINGQQVVTAIGNVRLFQEIHPGAVPLELRADAAVLFLAAEQEAPVEGAPPGGEVQEPPRDLAEEQAAGPGVEVQGLGAGAAVEGMNIEGAYLEGDVVLTRGERMIRASQLYYDLANDRALILDAVARAIEPTRGVPIYVRAEQVRQLSRTEYAAWNAKITTSEFFSPHYHVGAGKARFTDRTSRSAVGVAAGLRAGTYEMHHATFNLGGFPLVYWPYTRGDFKEGETTIRSVRTGYSSDFGATFETEWHLFNVMGVERPPGFDGTLRLDYYTERGPGAGIDLDYKRDDYFGLYRGYYIHDDGQDNLGRFRDEEPDSRHRGRTTLRHRHYLPDDWQLTLEVSYISDRGFLEEYFESEFEEGKDQETLLYLKKQKDNWALTGLAQWRILDWLTQTEHLPDFAFHLVGESLADRATFFSENRAGFVRYRPGERELLEYLFLRPREDSSGTVARADSRQEIELPLSVGPVRLVPFGSIRGSMWDDSPKSGGVQRVLGTAGVRGSMYLSRVFPEVRSQLLDVDGIRHIIKGDITAWIAGSNRSSEGLHPFPRNIKDLDEVGDVIAWLAGANRSSADLYPFTPNIEDLDDVSGVTAGIRQRWQTRRGGPGQRRTVDLVILDLELGVFNNAQRHETTNGFASYSRPENSISRNYLNAAVNYRVNDATALLSEANFDLNDQELDIFNVALAVERDPRFSYLLGYRFINEIDSSLLVFGANYQISEKHTLALRESFDLDRGQTQEFTLGFIRKFPRWYVGVTVDLNEADDDFGISLSAWPEGLPRTALGSRRFTGLATSTGIRPE